MNYDMQYQLRLLNSVRIKKRVWMVAHYFDSAFKNCLQIVGIKIQFRDVTYFYHRIM